MYAELICRTHYSFLRGASHPSELVQRAAELGLVALAITDRDGVYGIPKAYRASQTCPNLKLIVGAELTLESPLGIPDQVLSLHLLAKDRSGYGLLCRLLTASHEGQAKGRALLSWSRFLELMGEPSSAGLIALIRTPTQELFPYAALSGLFPGRIYLALARVLDGGDRVRTEQTVELSRKFQLPIIATNDVHFHLRPRRVLHDVLTAIRENTCLDQIGRRIFSNSERYLKSPREMKALFADMPEALSNTLRVAEQCSFSPSELRYYYPSEWIPIGETAQSYLTRLTWKGAEGRYPAGIPEDVTHQLLHELELIEKVRFADYFLTIWEIVEFARTRKILCQGRGSAANSAVCFCLGITAIDPVRMNLLFERFISVERGEPPDIDVDFEHERREEVIQHIYEKYGRHRAGMVSAIITYRTRSAIRDVKKAIGEDRYARNEESSLALVSELKGVPRHLSIHSGGFTLSACPIIETVPIEPARMEGRTIVQWDKEDLDSIGLLKVDILALGMLSAIRKTFDSVATRHAVSLTVATIPPDDERTYQMIRRAETVGVFQIESRAQMNMLRRLLPENFYDLVIQVAIVRPGPIQGKMVHPYLKRRRHLEDSRCPDPRMEPILSRTLGVPLFQEQVMKIAMVMANFTPGEADELRRAIGAWRSSGSIEKIGNRLQQGLLASGLAPEFVERIFQQIQGFAEYGFPESHAASFALLAYASSYLKCHYPAEFTCALLNSQPMGFYSSYTLVEDVKRQGVEVRPLDPCRSEWDCTLEGRALRMGWRMVQGLGRAEAGELLEERGRRSFSGLPDFISRVRLSLRVLNRLAMGDAFVGFGLSQREALWEILHLQMYRSMYRPMNRPMNQKAGRPAPVREQQLSLFQYGAESSPSSALFSPLSPYQAIQADYESYHLSVKGHPMMALRADQELRKQIPSTTSATLKQMKASQVTRLAGLVIVRQRPPTAKGTMFATLEDEWGFADLILHASTFEKYRAYFESSPFIVVAGKVQRDGELVTLLVSSVAQFQVAHLAG